MAVNPNEDTEFNDALRKHGILPPKEKEPESPSPPPSPSLSDELNELTLDQLKEKGEDAYDSDTERAIASMQRQRQADILRAGREARFGRIYPISREDYTREVTEASSAPEVEEEQSGTGVVCFLYKDGHTASERTFAFLRTLAGQYPQTKFVSIVGDKCIPNYPDRNLPSLILYRNGKVVDNLIAWGANEKQPGTIHHLETVLLGLGIITIPKLPQEHAARARQAAPRDDDDESDGDDPPPQSKFSHSRTNKKNIRKAEDSDSDFDL